MKELGFAYNNDLPYQIKGLVSILLFPEFPSTILYIDTEGNPIIKEWVDCSDDGEIDRFFYYKPTLLNLKKFLLGDLPHIKLIEEALDKLLFFQDELQEIRQNSFCISSENLPADYRPSNEFLFIEGENIDLENIFELFSLNNLDIEVEHLTKIISIANSTSTETLNIHLENGKGVSHGVINTKILGDALIKFEDFFNNIGLDYYYSKQRGTFYKTSKEFLAKAPYFSTQVYEKVAASYSVLLKAQFSEFSLLSESGSSSFEEIYKMVNNLLSNSKSKETLEDDYLNYSKKTILSYKEFLKSISEWEIKMNIFYYSPVSLLKISHNINSNSANNILTWIKQYNVLNLEKIEISGHFRAINCDTLHFNFLDDKGMQYNGYFDKELQDGTVSINFIQTYSIVLNRLITKEPDETEVIEDKISAFYPLK